MKHNIYKFSLFLKMLCFVSKGSLNIPVYKCALTGRVQYLYTLEHAVEIIAYHMFQSISVTLLSLGLPVTSCPHPIYTYLNCTKTLKFSPFLPFQYYTYILVLIGFIKIFGLFGSPCNCFIILMSVKKN